MSNFPSDASGNWNRERVLCTTLYVWNLNYFNPNLIRFEKFCLKFCQFRFWKIYHFCVTNLKKFKNFTSTVPIVSGQLDTSSLHQIFFQILLIDVKEWIQMDHKSRLDKNSKRKVNLLSPWKCQIFHLTLPVTETKRECFAPLMGGGHLRLPPLIN